MKRVCRGAIGHRRDVTSSVVQDTQELDAPGCLALSLFVVWSLGQVIHAACRTVNGIHIIVLSQSGLSFVSTAPTKPNV